MTTIAPATTTRQEPRPMLIVDCPLCDAPAPYDEDADALDCPACAIRLQVATGEDTPTLAAAA